MKRRPASIAAVLCCALTPLACGGGGGGGGTGPGYSVTIQPAAAAMCVGDNLAYTAQVLDGSGHPVAGAAPSWSSGTPAVATIDPASGVAHGVTTGTTSITASYSGATSAPATLDVPADLVPQFVPDSVVLAPGDTMTLGVRLRRASSGLVPTGHVPAIAAFDSAVAGITAAGLVTAKAAGRVGLSLSACGQQGGGAADVYTPPDSVTGMAYLWLSGPKELRARLTARVINFTRTNGRPGVEIGDSATRSFAYVDTVNVAGTAALPLDSLNTGELVAKLQCAPPRPFASYSDATSLVSPTVLLSLEGGSARITGYAARTGYATVSGRLVFRMRGLVNAQPVLDTLSAIYTFSAPAVTWGNACP
ncbi:MAG TPA: Ig-like domain-containing protein [Candidatus Methylomirabilis sp.]|nr:Ig-like domain-containing protein [Gemmatimonadales bacterium]HYB41350.1 Ig-like domain-containing protein [Candidatus Methylomirabilis sp.]